MSTRVKGSFERLPIETGGGPERKIVTTVEALLVRPNDPGLIDAVVKMLLENPAEFIEVVSTYFAVPTSKHLQTSPEKDQFPCGKAKTWQNYVGTQTADPFEIACPKTLSDLQSILKQAALLKSPVRAVGSHHAWSDAALTDGIAIETHGLTDPLVTADPTLLKDPNDAATVMVASGGMTIRDLNQALDQRGLALVNMGGFDGQTLAGVISTSTHGSGITLGAFPSFVEALVVINADGEVLQIEKTDGITDPVKFAEHGGNVRLIQDDKVFNASVVGIGCLGIIFKVLLRVRTQYWLSETRTIHKWTDLRQSLQDGSILPKFRHVEVLINPHVINGDNTCLLTLRQEVPRPAKPSPPKPLRNLFAEFLASRPGAGEFLAKLVATFPAVSPKLVEGAIKNLEDTKEFVALSYIMLNIGAANGFPALCSELGVDLNGHVDAVDMILEIVAQSRSEGAYHSGVIALRYVAPSPGFLSMQPRETCTIELPMLRGVFGADALTWRYETALVDQFNARPHWGQRNFLTGSHEMLERIYGQANVSDWIDVFQSFNPSGEFYSRFTDRVGFSTHAPKP